MDPYRPPPVIVPSKRDLFGPIIRLLMLLAIPMPGAFWVVLAHVWQRPQGDVMPQFMAFLYFLVAAFFGSVIQKNLVKRGYRMVGRFLAHSWWIVFYGFLALRVLFGWAWPVARWTLRWLWHGYPPEPKTPVVEGDA